MKKVLTATVNFLVRFSDKLYSVEDTIEEHKKLIDKEGAVWFGKVGKSLSERYITKLNEQCDNGKNTYLFLVQRVGSSFDAYQCKVARVALEQPKGEAKMIPKYYKQSGIDKDMHLWAKVTEIKHMEKREFESLRVLSSGSPVAESLQRSMAGLFIVQ